MNVEEAIQDLRQRLMLVEQRMEQLFEHLDIAPRGGGSPDPSEDPEIQDLLAKGNEMQAIKRYSEMTGLGLKEAKEAIDRAQA